VGPFVEFQDRSALTCGAELYTGLKTDRCSPVADSKRCLRVREPELAGAYEVQRLAHLLEKHWPKTKSDASDTDSDSLTPDHEFAPFMPGPFGQHYSHLSELMNRMKTVTSERFNANLHITSASLDRIPVDAEDRGYSPHAANFEADRVRNPSAEVTMMLFFDGRFSIAFRDEPDPVKNETHTAHAPDQAAQSQQGQ